MGQRLVLLAEDDAVFARELARIFEDEGWAVEVVGDGLSALGRLRQEPTPSLVCLDLVLPGVDGWRFYAEVRANPRFPKLPVLVLSGTRSTPDIDLEGILAFVRKPTSAATRERFEQELRAVLARLTSAA